MKRNIKFSMQGRRADIGEYTINRMLPNRYADSIGPFVFLDHLLPTKHSPGEPLKKVDGSGAHPHRGIATLTYILNGEANHFDSNGNRAKVRSGGVQWMKAGTGIIHDEAVNVDGQSNNLVTHAMQFWINLPAKNKAEPPKYIPLQAEEIPAQTLREQSGWIKVIAGEYEKLVSKIPDYTKQFIYHIHLEAGRQFSLPAESQLEYAVFLPLHEATINGAEHKRGELIVFDQTEGTIEINNNTSDAIDIILFGGAPYTEPIVFGGPFVMTSELEVAEAYKDFYAGKYGRIDYSLEPVL